MPVKIEKGLGFSNPSFCDILRFGRPNDYSFISDVNVLESGTINIMGQTDDLLKFQLELEKIYEDYDRIYNLYLADLYLKAYTNDSIQIYNTVTDGGYISMLLVRKE